MCGLAGLLAPRPGRDLERNARLMADTLAHRGPDDSGIWCDPVAGVAMGHRRLAIRDPTPDGAQPMRSSSGRWTLAFNGELYNAEELADQVGRHGLRFRGGSDTEVLVECLDAWGVVGTLGRLNAMFAFAAWDAAEHRLWLARDHFGIKPLYYGWAGDELVFGSELRALSAHPRFDGALDQEAVALMLQTQSVPSPATVFAAARKLPPGHLLCTSPAGVATEVLRWWDPQQVVHTAREARGQESDESVVDRVEELLADSVRRQMVSDVPLGAFLSGGVDSSLVVALMQQATGTPVRTFAAGFDDPRLDESEYAAAVARHLGTEHTQVRISNRDVADLVPHLAELWDEPFADASQIPTYLVARLARESVTVALSGDGGDELFGGYSTYAIAERAWRVVRWLPPPARAPLSSDRAHAACTQVVRSAMRRAPEQARERAVLRAHRVVDLLGAESDLDVHARLGRRWRGRAPVLLQPGADGRRPASERVFGSAGELSFFERMMLTDATTYMADTVLTKVDRASMAVGLEVRVPLLDPRVFTTAWSLPQNALVRGGTQKWVLRQVLHRHVPALLVDRPKKGFAVPLGDWLRGPLRPWADDLLDRSSLGDAGLLDVPRVRRAWQEHTSGSNREEDLWPVLMFQAWRASQQAT